MLYPQERAVKLYEQQHHERIAFEKDARTIVTGDSIANCLCRYPSSWNVLESAYASANYGIGGDTVENVLSRSEHGLYPPNVRNVIAIVGTNNLNKRQYAKEIAQGIVDVGKIFRTRFENANIFIVGILPRDQVNDQYYIHKKRTDVNRYLLSECNDLGFQYIDTSSFEGDNCRIDNILYDQKKLHLNEQGNVKLSTMIVECINAHTMSYVPRHSPADDDDDRLA